MEAARRSPSVLKILERIFAAQDAIKTVADAFDSTNYDLFGEMQDKIDCKIALINDGTFRQFVDSIFSEQDLSLLRLRTISKYRQYGRGISQWTAMLQKKFTKQSVRERDEDLFEVKETDEYIERDEERWRPEQNRAAYESMKAGRILIIDAMKIGQVEKAKELCNNLVIEQQISSKPEHIAKTLDSLAQEAKELGASELQLEWTERAYRINPGDPLTSGHHADALIGVGRIVEAEEALLRTEALGNVAFAGKMRARILRLKGRFEEARAAYLENAEFHAGDPEAWRAHLGAAECLRDLNRLDEAQVEYQRLVSRWPNNPILRAGLASARMDAGNFQQAIIDFGISISNNGGIVPRCGRASAYKLAGQYEEAIKLYDSCALDAPNNEAVFCGRAEVFRAKGDLEGALTAFDLAIERSPLSVQAIIGKAEVLEDLGRISASSDALKYGLSKFPGEEAFAIGLARLMRRTHPLHEALAEFDRLSKELPDNGWIAFNRVLVLRRTGNYEAALRALMMLLDRWPNNAPASNSLISTFIQMGRLSEARSLMNFQSPLSTHDWRQVILHSMLYKAEGDFETAIEVLKNAAQRVPFARERKLMYSTLAYFNIERGNYKSASDFPELDSSPIGDVIAFHAHVISPHAIRRKKATFLYEKIIGHKFEADIINLGTEIARRFNLVSQRPVHSREWILAAEQKLLMQEVA